jgi:hypothetical protein
LKVKIARKSNNIRMSLPVSLISARAWLSNLLLTPLDVRSDDCIHSLEGHNNPKQPHDFIYGRILNNSKSVLCKTHRQQPY